MPPPVVVSRGETRTYDFGGVYHSDWVGEIAQLVRETRADAAFVGRDIYEAVRQISDRSIHEQRPRGDSVNMLGTPLTYVASLGRAEMLLVFPPPRQPQVRLEDVRTRRFDIIERGPTVSIDEVRNRRFNLPAPTAPLPRSVWERLDDE